MSAWNNTAAAKAYFSEYYKTNKDKLDAVNKIAAEKDSYISWKKLYMRDYNKIYTENNRAKYNAKATKRHAAKLKRTPKWLTKDDFKKIDSFYEEAVRLSRETGVPHEVDHIIPLQGKTISGLHVPSNLRVITEKENNKKRNKFIPELLNEKNS